MCKIQIYIALVLTASGVVSAGEGEVLPAGKCLQRYFQPLKINFDKISQYGRWNIIYATDYESFIDVDHAYHEFNAVHSNIFVMNTTRVFKDKSKSVYTYTLTYDNGILVEETSDDNGNIISFHDYPLFITPEKSALYYRCSVESARDGGVDTRYIVVPASRNMGESEEQRLLEADAKLNFNGKLIKLPRQFA